MKTNLPLSASRSGWLRCPKLLTALTAVLMVLAATPPLRAQGTLDPLDANIVGNFVLASAVQPDGKTIIAGSFSSVLGQVRKNVARLNADGTLDPTFIADTDVDGYVTSVVVQADGKILLGGAFTTVNGTPRQYIARVEGVNGNLDPDFDPKANGGVESLALQRDGKILLGGWFTTLQPNGAAPTTRKHIARLNADGSLDAGFDPNPDDAVLCMAVQPDGNIVVGGYFTHLQPPGAVLTTRQHIARINANGNLDANFNPNADETVFTVALQPNGKILLGGWFTTVGGQQRQAIARLNADGSLDPAFDANPDGSVFSILVQTNEKI